MIDMVGIGPFVTMALVIDIMSGPQCIIAWVIGALLAFFDAMVWSELGAKWPEAGGSFVFLRKLYGETSWGKLLSFLFIWQTTFQAPLVIASGAIGFAEHVGYLVPLTPLTQKLVSGALVLMLTFALYRKITTAGKISMGLWVVLIITIIGIIIAGATHFNSQLAFTYPDNAFTLSPLFFMVLGQAMGKSVYSYLGYYNVCHLGAEIQEPERNIPRSMFISIAGIAVIYIAMQLSILGTLPWQEARHSKFVFSLFFERLYGTTAAEVITVLILVIAAASLFSAMLGYSRIPYAAAKEGAFFKVFARVHPTKHFPHVSLLVLGALGFVFSVFFDRMSDVISAILAMRIMIQFIGQTVGLIYYRRKAQASRLSEMPYKMPLFPLPAILSIAIWLFVFYFTGLPFIASAIGVIAIGAVVYLVRARMIGEWPFNSRLSTSA
jgi:fructoselysine transporter